MKTILSIAFLLFGSLLFGQSPQLINYQGVARNSSGALITNQHIGVRFTIHGGSLTGTILYMEKDTATTNAFGLFTTAIGGGQVQAGTSLSAINWGSTGGAYLQVEFDATGTNTFTDMGTTQLLSVPYAMYSGQAALDYDYKYDSIVQDHSTVRNAWVDVTNNALTVTAPSDGVYLVNAYGRMWDGSASESYLMQVADNNGNSIARTMLQGIGGVYYAESASVTAIHTMHAGDKLKVQFQMYGSGTNLYSYGGSGGQPTGGSGITIVRIK